MAVVQVGPRILGGHWNNVAPSTNPTFKPKRAGTNGVLIYFVLDASGSMGGREDDTIGGFNGYINDQKKKDGKAFVSAIKFEGGNIKRIYDRVEVGAVRPLTREDYYVGGGTNLQDAVGFALTDINNYMKQIDKENRPAPIVVIITDGMENQSRTWNADNLKGQMEHCQGRGWQAVYMGANADAWTTQQVAASMGLHSSKAFNYSLDNLETAYASISDTTTVMRGVVGSGAQLDATADYFTLSGARDKEVK